MTNLKKIVASSNKDLLEPQTASKSLVNNIEKDLNHLLSELRKHAASSNDNVLEEPAHKIEAIKDNFGKLVHNFRSLRDQSISVFNKINLQNERLVLINRIKTALLEVEEKKF